MMPSLCEKVVCFDLDDTLYKEYDYLKSAFREVAVYISKYSKLTVEAIYSEMITSWIEGKFPFQEICSKYVTGITVEQCLQIYREHNPVIHLDAGIRVALTDLTENGCILGLITDGRSITQRNKIKALGLNSFFRQNHIVISEEFGSRKPSEHNFSYFMELHPNARLTYIGDNTKKDFITPNCLGWKTICLLDDGTNITKQDFSLHDIYLPKFCVKHMQEIVDIIIKD